MQIEIERVKMENTKLVSKDLILIGALNAVMFIIYMIISVAMSLAGPATNVFIRRLSRL